MCVVSSVDGAMAQMVHHSHECRVSCARVGVGSPSASGASW